MKSKFDWIIRAECFETEGEGFLWWGKSNSSRKHLITRSSLSFESFLRESLGLFISWCLHTCTGASIHNGSSCSLLWKHSYVSLVCVDVMKLWRDENTTWTWKWSNFYKQKIWESWKSTFFIKIKIRSLRMVWGQLGRSKMYGNWWLV